MIPKRNHYQKEIFTDFYSVPDCGQLKESKIFVVSKKEKLINVNRRIIFLKKETAEKKSENSKMKKKTVQLLLMDGLRGSRSSSLVHNFKKCMQNF